MVRLFKNGGDSKALLHLGQLLLWEGESETDKEAL